LFHLALSFVILYYLDGEYLGIQIYQVCINLICILAERLEASNKIAFDGKRIVWIAADNPKLRRFLETSIRVR